MNHTCVLVGKLSFNGNELNLTVTITTMITNEVMLNLNMFGSGVLNLIFCEIYCTCVVTE